METKRLYRSRTNRVIWGVCGGLAEYFNIDPVIVRVIAVLSIFLQGFGILAYIIMAIVIPLEKSRASTPRETVRENVQEMKGTVSHLGEQARAEQTNITEDRSRNSGMLVVGILLLVLGLIFFIFAVGPFSAWWFRYSWPVIIIIIGIIFILFARRT